MSQHEVLGTVRQHLCIGIASLIVMFASIPAMAGEQQKSIGTKAPVTTDDYIEFEGYPFVAGYISGVRDMWIETNLQTNRGAANCAMSPSNRQIVDLIRSRFAHTYMPKAVVSAFEYYCNEGWRTQESR